MGIRYYRPTSAGRRGASVSDFAEITDRKKRPEKSLLVRLKKNSGRNFHGKITTRHRGGGARTLYRLIDFKRRKDGVPAQVAAIEYDPNRTCRIALLHYADGEKAYILAPEGLKAGARVESGSSIEPNIGNCLPLENIPPGTAVHNVEMQPGRGGQLCRSAGTSAVMNAREGDWAQITLPSGEVRRVPSQCRATVGARGNMEHNAIRQGGTEALDGHSAPRARGGNESGRPPDGGRRGAQQGGPAPLQPDGEVGQGRANTQASQAFDGGHYPSTALAAVRAVEAVTEAE